MLSEFVFSPAELRVASTETIDTSVSMATQGSQRILALKSPWIVKNSQAIRQATKWSEACAQFRNFGVPVFSKLEEMNDVSAVAVPSRFASRSDGEPFSADEVESADAFELRLRSHKGVSFSLPIELTDICQLRSLVEATRLAAGNSTPIGLELPIGVGESALQACLEAKPDFISLANYETLGLSLLDQHRLLLDSVKAYHEQSNCSEATNCHLLADVSLGSCEDAVKLLALGIQQVAIDSLLHPILQRTSQEESAVGGMLANLGVAATSSPSSLDAVVEVLTKLNSTLHNFMAFCGCGNLDEFRLLGQSGRLKRPDS